MSHRALDSCAHLLVVEIQAELPCDEMNVPQQIRGRAQRARRRNRVGPLRAAAAVQIPFLLLARGRRVVLGAPGVRTLRFPALSTAHRAAQIPPTPVSAARQESDSAVRAPGPREGPPAGEPPYGAHRPVVCKREPSQLRRSSIPTLLPPKLSGQVRYEKPASSATLSFSLITRPLSRGQHGSGQWAIFSRLSRSRPVGGIYPSTSGGVLLSGEGRYPKGEKITDEQFSTIKLKREKFHGDWNYTILPNSRRR